MGMLDMGLPLKKVDVYRWHLLPKASIMWAHGEHEASQIAIHKAKVSAWIARGWMPVRR
jgi:hypothetical protein